MEVETRECGGREEKKRKKKCQSKLKRTGVSDNNLMRFDLRPPPCDDAAADDDDDDDDETAPAFFVVRNRIISTEVLRA